MPAPLGRLVLYTKKMEEMIAFYCRHFAFQEKRSDNDRIIELQPRAGGVSLLLHPAAKGQREGQVLVKLVFDVENVPEFCATAAKEGLDFGTIHEADGYVFANAKDPSKNSIQISSRAFAG